MLDKLDTKIKYYKEDFSHGSLINVHFFSLLQLIQTISAVDKDDPLGGQNFLQFSCC